VTIGVRRNYTGYLHLHLAFIEKRLHEGFTAKKIAQELIRLGVKTPWAAYNITDEATNIAGTINTLRIDYFHMRGAVVKSAKVLRLARWHTWTPEKQYEEFEREDNNYNGDRYGSLQDTTNEFTFSTGPYRVKKINPKNVL
jgi:hypothetical protein